MPTAWIYTLTRQELIDELEQRNIQIERTNTVDELRKQLAQLIKAEDTAKQATKMSNGSEMKEFDKAISRWKIQFDTTKDAVEFLEQLEELADTLKVNKDKIIHVIPRCLSGEASLWYRNNVEHWDSWKDFTKDFKLYFYPRNYEKNLLEKIIKRRQDDREGFIQYLTGIQTLMRRYGKLTQEEQLERVYDNMKPNYQYYIKRKDFETITELIQMAKDYEKINTERARTTQGNKAYIGKTQNKEYNATRNQPEPAEAGTTDKKRINPYYNAEDCCWKCGKKNHKAKECRNRQFIFCSICGVTGKLTRNCCKQTKQTNMKTKQAYTTETTEGKDNRMFIDVKIQGKPYKALVDTGSTNTYINKKIMEEVKFGSEELKEKVSRVRLADGTTTETRRAAVIEIEIKGHKIKHQVICLPNTPMAIIGMDILQRIGCTINWRNQKGTTQQVQSAEQDIQEGLTTAQRRQLEETLNKEFQKAENSPKGNTWVKHTIKLKHRTPIKQKHYPRNPKMQEKINEHIDKMLAEGVIEKSNSPYSSPIVMAKKDNGEYRFCIDFRKINEITEKDAYPIPQIDDTLEKLTKGKYFSKFDLKNGYWNVSLDDASKPITAFTVPGRGLFHFKVMPFGLHSSGATFQRLLDRVIGPELEPNAYVYLDDIIVCSETFEEHVKHIKEIFRRIREAGLRINKDKCEFGKPQIEYLGHIVTKEGLQMDEAKIQAIKQLRTPENVKDVRRFLGMTSWYRKFIPNYADITAPLARLLKKEEKFKWTKEQEQSFEALKAKLMAEPILTRADFTKDFIIETDASDIGIAAVLGQETAGERKVIMYASRKLQPPETKYSTTEKECLAVVWAIRKMRPFIEGYHFTVITDHQALKWLHNLKNPSGRLARWALELQQYDFDIRYRPGKQNATADELSRNPTCAAATGSGEWYMKKKEEIENNTAQNEEYCIKDGKLYKKVSNPRYGGKLDPTTEWKLCVRNSEKQEILKENHDEPNAGHLGIAKTFNRVAQRYYWPGIFRDVAKYVRKCEKCQKHKGLQTNTAGKMHVKNAEEPWETVTTDLMGPLPRSSKGFQWIIVFHDKFTKWSEIKALRTATANTVAAALKECVLMRHGGIKNLVSDNARIFTSKTFKDTLERYGIKHRLTPAYTPQCNPTERVNRTLGTMLATYVEKNHKKWDEHLAEFNYALNTSTQESTKYTPAFLLFGRELRNIYDKNEFPTPSLKEKQKIQEIYEIVKRNQHQASSHQKKHYDRNRRDWKPKINELVLKREYPLSKAEKQFCAKLAPKYSGPYKVVSEESPVIFKLRNQTDNKTHRVHIKDMKQFFNQPE